MLLVEKQLLQLVSSLLSIESNPNQSITRNVGKDNTVRFESNRYSVPLGTYGSQPENEVYIETECGETNKLIIRKKTNGEILAEHPISSEKGILIKNRTHT